MQPYPPDGGPPRPEQPSFPGMTQQPSFPGMPQQQNSMVDRAAACAAVVDKVRSGKTIPVDEACAYANSIEFKESNHTGCYTYQCMLSGCRGCVCCCGYHFYIGPCDCLCMPTCIWGLIPCCCFECVRKGNVYFSTREGGGHLMVIDAERGTLAYYNDDDREACCHCVRC